MIRFADSLRDIRKSLVVRGMSRAGGQIPGLAALDRKNKICDGSSWAGGIGFAMELRWIWLGVKRDVSRGGADSRAGGVGFAMEMRWKWLGWRHWICNGNAMEMAWG